jgi:hypothetical protein
MLQHVTRSQGWNTTGRVSNVGNDIELCMVILAIRSQIWQVSQKQMEYDIDIYGSMMKDLHECTWVITDIPV